MNETKAAFAGRAIHSLKHINDRFIENHGEHFDHNLPQFLSTINCRVSRSIGKSPRDVNKTDFFSTLINKPLTTYKNQNSKLEIE